MPFGVGVIGIGFGKAVHVPAFRNDSRCEVIAIGASTSDRAREAAQTCGVPNSYGDWRELIADPDVQIVSLAVPASLQFEIAREAFRLGKHVFMEKPAAPTGAQARELVEVAEANNAHGMVDFEFVEAPGWTQLKQALANDELGRLNFVNVAWHVCSYAFRKRIFDSWKLRPDQDGGVLNLFGTHTFHYLEWLFGPIARIHARLPEAPSLPEGVEALAAMNVEFESGQTGAISLSNASFMGNGHRLEIYGERGSAILANATKDYIRGATLEIGDIDSDRTRRVECDAGGNTRIDSRIAPVSRMVDRFITALEGGPSDFPSIRDGWRVQCLVDLARASNNEGVWLSAS